MADPNNFLSSDEIQKITEKLEESKDLLFAQTDLAKDLSKAFNDASLSTSSIFTNTTKTKDALNDVADLYSRLGTTYIKMSSIQERMTKNEFLRNKILGEIKKNTASMNLTQSDLADFIEIIKDDSFQISTQNDNILKTLVTQLKTVQELDEHYGGLIIKLEESNEQAYKLADKMGMVGRIMSRMQKIPFLGDILNFKKITDKMEDEAAKKDSTRADVRKAGWEALKEETGKALKDPMTWGLLTMAAISGIITLMKKLLDTVFKIDNGITKIANNIGMGKDGAAGIYTNFVNITKEGKVYADNLDRALLSMTNQMEALTGLQDSLGTNAMLSLQTVHNQLLLTKQMGFTAEEAANIQKYSILTNKSAESLLQTIVKQNTASISYKKLIKEVSGISAELSMRYGNNVEQIAKAVVQANKLGMSLEETSKISNSLLNFETSIEGELESELLLGKQFNFEKARELALMGKSSEAAGELLKQIGGINSLEKMNVIQRERVAAAIGLSSDELSKAAKEQAILTNLGVQNKNALQEQYDLLVKNHDTVGLTALQDKIRNQENGEVLLSQISQLSVQQRFEESMNKVKEILANIVAGPLMGFINGIVKFLEHTTVLKAMLAGIAGLVAAITVPLLTLAFTLNPIGSAIAAVAASAVVGGALFSMSDSPYQGSVKDSVIDPSGQVMISTPKGGIIPDKNDSIITTTNPQGLLNGGGGGNDNSAVVAKLDELIGHVQKGGNVYIDSTNSGRAYGMSYNSYA